MNKKAQEVGSLGWMLIALLCVSAVATLGLDYIRGLSQNYDVPLNESEYLIFSSIGNPNSTISDISAQIIPEDPQQAGDINIIDIIISGGYGAIKLFFNIPVLFAELIQAGVYSIGLSSASAGVVASLLTGIVLILVLVAVIALILKVRP